MQIKNILFVAINTQLVQWKRVHEHNKCDEEQNKTRKKSIFFLQILK